MRVLIVARPDRWRDGLQALLEALPQVDYIDHAESGSAALSLIDENHPALAFVDASLPAADVSAVLGKIRVEKPTTHCIALTSSGQQKADVQAAGAERTLLKGFTADTLYTTITEVMSERHGTDASLASAAHSSTPAPRG